MTTRNPFVFKRQRQNIDRSRLVLCNTADTHPSHFFAQPLLRRRSSSHRLGRRPNSSGFKPRGATMPSRLKKGFWERAGERQERLIRRYEEHMAKAQGAGTAGSSARPPRTCGRSTT